MKKLLILILFFPFFASAQDSSWHSKLIVKYKNNTPDTVYFGCDVNGGIGYQKGIDFLDTPFIRHSLLAFSIRANDSSIDSQFDKNCIKLKRDIKGFKVGMVSFKFYILDTFYNADSNVYIKWDTSDFKFNNGKYKIFYADFTSDAATFNGVDNHEYSIMLKSSTYYFNSPSFVFGGYINDSICPNANSFKLNVYFDILSDVETPESNSTYFYISPNPCSNLLNLNFAENFTGVIEIYNVLGMKISNAYLSSEKMAYFNMQCPAGIYFMKVKNINNNIQTIKFIKQ